MRAMNPAPWAMPFAQWNWGSRLAFFVLLSLYTRLGAQNVTDEMDALTQFQAITAVDSQSSSGGSKTYEPRGYWDSWDKTNKNPCKWVGISCTSSNSVRSIDLSGWGLTKLWGLSDLSRLPNLEQLTLSRNDFNTEVPEDIGTLTNLRVLDLSDSSFTGLLPSNLNLLWNLRSLYLDGNIFIGNIPPLSNLTQLQVLSLARNQLDGPIPTYLNTLLSLVSLDISSNSFNGSVPELTTLVNLYELNLANNTLTGFRDPKFPGPKNLKHLFTSRNQFRGSLPAGLTQMMNLEVLDMSFNKFSGEIPEGLARQMNHSYWLDLSHNQLEGNIPNDLFLAPQRRQALSLNLSYNLLTGSIPGVPVVNESDFWYFAALDLSHNQLVGSLPAPLTLEINQSTPRILWLEDNQLTGDLVELLPRWSFTEEIRLAKNRFTGDLTDMIENWSILSYKLQILDLSDNLLTMTKTENYSDPVRSTVESLVAMSVLKEFRIAGNNFEGETLPTEFLRMGPQTLEVLDISRSRLVGPIVEEAFSPSTLPLIKVLNFSRNNLSGPVPLNITRLPNLIALDLSGNNLSGKLPEMPPNSSLRNPEFFAGNSGLCGDPLPACPSPAPPQPPPIVIVVRKNGLSKGALIGIILSSVMVPLASCLIVGWRWRVYKKLHEQDADLIATLLERETTALMPLRELRKATDNFSESAQIGEGGFGTVYVGKLQDGSIVAIKRNKREGTEADKQQFLNEVRILSQVSHRHLVKLLGCCMENKSSLLVFEFVCNGTLQEHLQGKKDSALSWKQRLRIAIQAADALNYLHSAAHFPIIHRDVKSANILLTEKLEVKVADFGISKLAPAEAREATHFSTVAVQGTIGYIDPEYYTRFQLNAKSDVYSFGVVLLELISAQPAINFQRPGAEASLIMYATPLIQKGELDTLIDPVLIASADLQTRESMTSVGNLALQCLEGRSKVRPDMREVWTELQTIWNAFGGAAELEEANSVCVPRESFNISNGSSPLLSDTTQFKAASPKPR
ncbi:hypothetical protein R1flu_000293 [Riccia fluitans]|uniref:Protein kinase domain-containing protein n=1 Tax=Riccia fluitans TaxID=41844 RepID=A0ABD1Y091_9MARC